MCKCGHDLIEHALNGKCLHSEMEDGKKNYVCNCHTRELDETQ